MARLAHYVMASEWRAALMASALLFLPLVSWMGAAIVALYGLRRGFTQAPMVAGIPALVALAMTAGFGDSAMLIVLVLTMVFAAVLHATLSWVAVLQVALGVSIVLVLLVGGLYEETLKALVVAIQEAVLGPGQLESLGVDAATIDAWMGSLAVGALSFVHMLSAFFALMFARALQAQAYNPGGFKAEFEAIRLQPMFATGCLLIALFGFMLDPWMLRFTPVAALPLMLSGIALVHGLTGMRESKGLLIMFYAAMIFFTPYLLLLLAVLAVVDAFVDFRTRAQQEPPNDEDE